MLTDGFDKDIDCKLILKSTSLYCCLSSGFYFPKLNFIKYNMADATSSKNVYHKLQEKAVHLKPLFRSCCTK